MRKRITRPVLIILLIIFSLSVISLYGADTLKSAVEVSKGVELFNSGKYEQAIGRFSKAISLDKSYDNAYFWKGVSLYKLGKYREAKKYLLKAVSLASPPEKSYYGWLSHVCKKLGEEKEALLYKKYSKNPPMGNKKILKVENIHRSYHKSGLREFNRFQKLLGNRPTRISMKLNNAAKRHALYLARHFFGKPITTQWHYQKRGKKGFVGIKPVDQAAAFGFYPSEGFFVGNTMTGWTHEKYSTAEYLISHLASTIYHRSMVIAPEFEAIGFYHLVKQGKHLIIYFYSHKSLPSKGRVVAYPATNQKNVNTTMLPEIPHPFPGDKSVGFPISVQNFTKDMKGVPLLIDYWLKDSKGRKIPLYKLTPESKGMAGTLMKMFKMVCITPEDPLKSNETYKAYMKVKDSTGRIIFNRKWSFTTGIQ